MSEIPPKEVADCNQRLAELFDDEINHYYVERNQMDDETMKELTGIVGELYGEAWVQRLKINVLEGAKGL